MSASIIPACAMQIDCEYCPQPGQHQCCPPWGRWQARIAVELGAQPWVDVTCADDNGFQRAFEQSWDWTDGRSTPWSQKKLRPCGHGEEMAWLLSITMDILRRNARPARPEIGHRVWNDDSASWMSITAVAALQPYAGRPPLADAWLITARPEAGPETNDAAAAGETAAEHCIYWFDGGWMTRDRPSVPHAERHIDQAI